MPQQTTPPNSDPRRSQRPRLSNRARPEVPPEFDALPIWTMDAPKLVAILKDPKLDRISEGDCL